MQKDPINREIFYRQFNSINFKFKIWRKINKFLKRFKHKFGDLYEFEWFKFQWYKIGLHKRITFSEDFERCEITK